MTSNRTSKPAPIAASHSWRRWEIIDANGHRRTVYKALGATLLEMRRQFPDATVRPLE